MNNIWNHYVIHRNRPIIWYVSFLGKSVCAVSILKCSAFVQIWNPLNLNFLLTEKTALESIQKFGSKYERTQMLGDSDF